MEVVPLGHALGAEIRGVDITGDIGDNSGAAIREAWHRHHIIVFRGVAWRPEQHLTFSRRFGSLDDHAATPHQRFEGYPELLEITNRAKNGQPSQSRNAGRNWHSDYSYTCLLYTSPSPRD